jgi:biopolymer transport protein TolR
LPDDKEPLTLTINAKGETFIQDTQVASGQLVSKILAMSKNRTDTRIYVRGDKSIDYGRVIEIMGLLSKAGFTKVALISGTSASKSKK